MPKPVCVKCRLFYRMKRNSVFWMECKPLSDETWVPYKVWNSDLWECKGCGAEILSGHGMNPVSEDYKPEFKDWVVDIELVVKDC